MPAGLFHRRCNTTCRARFKAIPSPKQTRVTPDTSEFLRTQGSALAPKLTPFFSIVYLWLSVSLSSCEGMGANRGNDAARSRNHRRANFFSGRISADLRTHL